MADLVPMALAPMAEISHRALRELIESAGGCDEYYTEMISASALLAGGEFEKWYVDPGPAPERLVYQLMGNDAGRIAAAAALLDRNYPCLGIDLNMGCSAPAITRAGAGCAWMRDAEVAGALVRAVRREVKGRLSVKLRLGPGGAPPPGEEERAFDGLLRFCRRLEAEGVDLITLHPRWGKEKFRRLARWEYVGRLQGELGVPVAGNGDIAGPEDLRARAASGLCSGVVAGRAAVKAPWLFAAAKALGAAPVTPGLVEETGLRFLELLPRYQPPEFHMSRARRFFSYFCANVTWSHYLLTRLNRESTLSGMEAVWRGYFRESR